MVHICPVSLRNPIWWSQGHALKGYLAEIRVLVLRLQYKPIIGSGGTHTGSDLTGADICTTL
jgi:hypothetical protein